MSYRSAKVEQKVMRGVEVSRYGVAGKQIVCAHCGGYLFPKRPDRI